LIAFGNWVGVRRLGSQQRFGIGLGIVFRLVAEAIRVRIIVPRALIIRDAIDDFIPNIGMFEADTHKLGQIARADPDRQPPFVDRPRAEIADPHAQKADLVLVGVEAGERL